jgi:hypothetical protein
MAAQQARVKRSAAAHASMEVGVEEATQTNHSQAASSQINFNQSRRERLELRQGYRSLRSNTMGVSKRREIDDPSWIITPFVLWISELTWASVLIELM